jgi:hypothetical protein
LSDLTSLLKCPAIFVIIWIEGIAIKTV